MLKHAKIVYLHGLESTSQSGKARQFAQRFPGMLTPDFTGSFDERMAQLTPILGDENGWTIIGSSFGGLMGAVFTLENESQVRKLVLLAPALMLPPFATLADRRTVAVPTVIVHGTEDDVVPLAPVRALAEKVFTNLTYHVVHDGHRLAKAYEELNWEAILA